jgi:hypothetical protein
MMSNQQSAIHTLGYTQQWIDYGVLTNKQLQTQLAEFNSGADPHPEHFRYRTLYSYIDTRIAIKNEEVGNLLKLMIEDGDSTMASSAVLLLLKHAYITNEQFETVAKVLATYGDWTDKEISRQRERRNRETLKGSNS